MNLSNTSAGQFTLDVDIPTDPYLLSGTFFVAFLNTDQNAGTGSFGDEYAIVIDGASSTVALARWTGVSWTYAVPQSTLSASWWYGPTISINRSDLGFVTGLDFWLYASWTGATEHIDYAPEVGWWRYTPGAAGAAGAVATGVGAAREPSQVASLRAEWVRAAEVGLMLPRDPRASAEELARRGAEG